MEQFNHSSLPVPSDVTLAAGTVHNPEDIRHFMKIKPVTAPVVVSYEGGVLARTRRALRVLEVGHDFYDPVLYIPREDVEGAIAQVRDFTTHCPIKGDAIYFRRPQDNEASAPIAWAYPDPIEIAAPLADHIAFDADVVEVTTNSRAG